MCFKMAEVLRTEIIFYVTGQKDKVQKSLADANMFEKQEQER